MHRRHCLLFSFSLILIGYFNSDFHFLLFFSPSRVRRLHQLFQSVNSSFPWSTRVSFSLVCKTTFTRTPCHPSYPVHGETNCSWGRTILILRVYSRCSVFYPPVCIILHLAWSSSRKHGSYLNISTSIPSSTTIYIPKSPWLRNVTYTSFLIFVRKVFPVKPLTEFCYV